MAGQFVDYYDVLQVPRSASAEEIKKAFRRLARQHHPDLHTEKDKDVHTAKMQAINEAYTVLSSQENREKYDRIGEHWQDGAPPKASPGETDGAPRSGEDAEAFSSFFRSMFHGMGDPNDRGNLSRSELDVEAQLDLSLEAAVKGVQQSLTLMVTGLCSHCHGTGMIKEMFCRVCGGVGEVRRPREIKARIPAGLTQGSRIKLKGQGGEGPHGRGDLYLQIHLIPDPRFVVEGKDLQTELRLMPWDAALGSEKSVPTLDGPIRIRIPKGTHAGKKLRLAGKGLGKPGKRGDLFILIVIDVPDLLSPKTEDLMRQMEEENHA